MYFVRCVRLWNLRRPGRMTCLGEIGYFFYFFSTAIGGFFFFSSFLNGLFNVFFVSFCNGTRLVYLPRSRWPFVAAVARKPKSWQKKKKNKSNDFTRIRISTPILLYYYTQYGVLTDVRKSSCVVHQRSVIKYVSDIDIA